MSRAARYTGYLRWLQGRTESIELRGIERAGGAPFVVLPLETAYVPLRAKPLPRVGDAPERMHSQRRPSGRRDRADDTGAGDREADVDLSWVLGPGNRLVIIGGPGSGKTTVLLHMTWALASSLLTGQAERSRLRLTMMPSELPLPILLPLASFARYRR